MFVHAQCGEPGHYISTCMKSVLLFCFFFRDGGESEVKVRQIRKNSHCMCIAPHGLHIPCRASSCLHGHAGHSASAVSKPTPAEHMPTRAAPLLQSKQLPTWTYWSLCMCILQAYTGWTYAPRAIHLSQSKPEPT